MAKDIYDEIHTDLRKKYDKQALNVAETAKEIGVSVETLRTGIKLKQNVPAHKQIGQGQERKKYIFPIHSVAKYLSDTQMVY